MNAFLRTSEKLKPLPQREQAEGGVPKQGKNHSAGCCLFVLLILWVDASVMVARVAQSVLLIS